ncbi:MAG: sugar isomerase [Mycobacteriaceae bacterium]|nr:sugar isomerase [Mycobacteriaceae bacterium]
MTPNATTGTHLAAEVASQPDSWARAAPLAARYHALLPQPGERVAVIGCGTSLFMARAIAELRETRGHGLTDAWSAAALRTDRDYDRYLVICRSGTTTDVLDALRALPENIPRTVITSSPATPVLDLADPILIAEADELSIVQTRFATTTLAILRSHLGEDLTDVVGQARAVLAADLADLDRMRRVEQITFVGTGIGAALAEEAALKLRESCQAWTEAYSIAEWRHGPASIAAPGRAVWAFGPTPPGLHAEVAATGADYIHHRIDPMAELVRLHRLCLVRAADAGLDPDRPRGLSRSVILAS